MRRDMAFNKTTWVLLHFLAFGFAAPNAKRATTPGYNALPYYPAPYGGWVSEWASSYEKAKKLVDSMTLAEKTNITAGTGLFMGMHHLKQSEGILLTWLRVRVRTPVLSVKLTISKTLQRK